MKQVQMKVLDNRLKDFGIPDYATKGSAGIDLRAMFEDTCGNSIVLKAGETRLVDTGMSIYIEDPKIAATILPRSGLGHKHGVVLGNLVGLIDSDYQGPLKVSLWNRGTEDFEIKLGDRIAQLVFIPVIQVSFDIVDEYQETDRGEGGFGHSGR